VIGFRGAAAVERVVSPGNRTTAKKQTISTLRTMLGPACRFMAVVRMVGSSRVHNLMVSSMSSATTTRDLSFLGPFYPREDYSKGVERTEENDWSMHVACIGVLQLLVRLESRSKQGGSDPGAVEDRIVG
jgi:hypothetical protein